MSLSVPRKKLSSSTYFLRKTLKLSVSLPELCFKPLTRVERLRIGGYSLPIPLTRQEQDRTNPSLVSLSKPVWEETQTKTSIGLLVRQPVQICAIVSPEETTSSRITTLSRRKTLGRPAAKTSGLFLVICLVVETSWKASIVRPESLKNSTTIRPPVPGTTIFREFRSSGKIETNFLVNSLAQRITGSVLSPSPRSPICSGFALTSTIRTTSEVSSSISFFLLCL